MKSLKLTLSEDTTLWRQFLEEPKKFSLIELPKMWDRLKMVIRHAENKKGFLMEEKPIFLIFHKEKEEIVFIFDLNFNCIVVSEAEPTEIELKFFEDNQQLYQENLVNFLSDSSNYYQEGDVNAG